VTATLLGMLCAAACRRAHWAIGLSYLAVAMLTIAPILLAMLIAGLGREPFYIYASALLTLGETVFNGTKERVLLPFFIFQPLLCLLCWKATLLLLNRVSEPTRVEAEKPIDDTAVLDERRKTFPFYLLDPMRRKKMIEDGRNPMRVKELRWGLMGRETRMVRIFYGMLIFFFVTGVAMIWDRGGLFWWLTFQILGVIVATPVVLVNAFSKEQEGGNFDMLRLTLLRPRDIVLGKVLAGWLSMLPFLLAMMVAGVPLMIVSFIWGDAQGLCLQAYGTLWVCAFLSLSLSLLGAMFAKRITGGLTFSFLLSLFVYFGVWVARSPLSALWHTLLFFGIRPYNMGLPREPNLSSPLFSPLVAYCAATSHAIQRNNWRTTGYFWDHYDNLWIGSMGLFFLVALALIALSVPLFAQLRMRAR
jgi:hypothetical protein